MAKMIKVSEKDFTEHVRRICRSNIRKGIKICIVCPFREDALRIMKKNGWKLPDSTKRAPVEHLPRSTGLQPGAPEERVYGVKK